MASSNALQWAPSNGVGDYVTMRTYASTNDQWANIPTYYPVDCPAMIAEPILGHAPSPMTRSHNACDVSSSKRKPIGRVQFNYVTLYAP